MSKTKRKVDKNKEVIPTPTDLQLSEESLKELQKYTPKQAAFYVWYARLGNGARAALKVYYPNFPLDKKYTKLTEEETIQYNTAHSIASENLRKHTNPIALYLEEQGMDLKLAADKLKEGMNATLPLGAKVIYEYGTGGKETKRTELLKVPDYPERREWWDRFAVLTGLKVKEETGQQQAQQTNVFINAKHEASKYIEDE